MKKAKDLKIAELSKKRESVKKLIAEIARMDADKIDESDGIRDDLGIDSLMAVEMLAAIEKRLGVVMDEAKAFDIVTVKDLIDLVMEWFKNKR
ncbi:MAG: acyl carrier protein [Candidatus Omnitrophota bacterium]|nr:acyl carrier protein [Candidatus Omnitrophota bacterium]